MLVSVIICTHNRAEQLRETLQSVGMLSFSSGLTGEFIIIDNASTDHTAAVIEAACIDNMQVRYIHEPRKGLSNARNTGVAAALGDIILFTDDDVRLPQTWVIDMCHPMKCGSADAVIGSISLAHHLRRQWMEPMHYAYLASTEWASSDTQLELVGANMGFRRAVLAKVPTFDTELDAGALGFCGDTLFSWQLRQAGFRIARIVESTVEHHPSESRLLRSSWIRRAIYEGKSMAHIDYHWTQDNNGPSRKQLLKYILLAKFLCLCGIRNSEGLDTKKIYVFYKYGFLTQSLIEIRRSRKYSIRGLQPL